LPGLQRGEVRDPLFANCLIGTPVRLAGVFSFVRSLCSVSLRLGLSVVVGLWTARESYAEHDNPVMQKLVWRRDCVQALLGS